MPRGEFIDRWSQRADDFKRLGAQVDGARVISEFLTELELLFQEEESETLTLEEAAEYSGYSRDHLGRLIKRGIITNVGRRYRPRVRRGDLPHKVHDLRQAEPATLILDNNRRQIARSVVTSNDERNDDG